MKGKTSMSWPNGRIVMHLDFAPFNCMLYAWAGDGLQEYMDSLLLIWHDGFMILLLRLFSKFLNDEMTK